MEEYNLSEFARRLEDGYNNGKTRISIPRDDSKCGDYERFLKNLMRDNEDFFSEYAKIGSGITYLITDEYRAYKDYLYNFLVMCESLFKGEMPTINRFNKEKLYSLGDKKILKILTGSNSEILMTRIKDKDLLEDEYFNILYKLNNNSMVNINNYKVKKSNNQINSNIVFNDTNTDKEPKTESKLSNQPKAKLTNEKEGKNEYKSYIKKIFLWIIGVIVVSLISAVVNNYIKEIIDFFKKIFTFLINLFGD